MICEQGIPGQMASPEQQALVLFSDLLLDGFAVAVKPNGNLTVAPSEYLSEEYRQRLKRHGRQLVRLVKEKEMWDRHHQQVMEAGGYDRPAEATAAAFGGLGLGAAGADRKKKAAASAASAAEMASLLEFEQACEADDDA